MIRSVVVGCGSYLPARVLTNADLAKIVDTSDEWIVERTGIRQRHIAADDEKTSDLALNAAKAALKHAGMTADDIDLIVLATATPDETFPATACRVQAGLGMTHGFAFDVQAVCSGFVYALATADNFIKAGQARAALVIGAETFSRILDWTDRTSRRIFIPMAAITTFSMSMAGRPALRPPATSACWAKRSSATPSSILPMWSRKHWPR